MKTKNFKSFLNNINATTSTTPLKWVWAEFSIGSDELVQIFSGAITFPERWNKIPVLQLKTEEGDVIAQTHDPLDIPGIWASLEAYLKPESFEKLIEDFKEAVEISYDQIFENPLKAALASSFLYRSIQLIQKDDGDFYDEKFSKLDGENKEYLSLYCSGGRSSEMEKLYYSHLRRIRGNDSFRFEERYEWYVTYAFLRKIMGYVPEEYQVGHKVFIVPGHNKYISDFATDERCGEIENMYIVLDSDVDVKTDFNSIRSISNLKKHFPEHFEEWRDQLRGITQKFNIPLTGFKTTIGGEYRRLEDGLLERFEEVENPSFLIAGKTPDWKAFSREKTNFFLSRNGNGIDRTFYGAIKREEDSMICQISNLTWDLHGAFFKGTDLLSILEENNILTKEELDSHVFSEKDFDGKSSGALRYYGDYSDYHFTVIDMEPCLWMDDGKTETNHLDEWPYVDSFLGKPTKEFNAAVMYAEIEIQKMIEKEFPTLMENQFPKKNGFWLNIKALMGRNTYQTVEYVRNQVRHYVLRLEVFDLLEELFTDSGYHQRSEYREWYRGLKGEEVPYEGDKWPRFMWNCYQKWEDKYKSLLKVKEALLSKEKKISDLERVPEKQVPENLPKYIEVLWDDVFKDSRDDDYISGFGSDVTPIKALVRTLTGEAYYRALKYISLVGSDGSSYPWVRFKIKTNSLAYLFLGMYNMLRKRGRNWDDFEKTHESSLSQDLRHMWVWKKYGCISKDDGRRIEIFSPSVKIKIFGECIRIIHA